MVKSLEDRVHVEREGSSPAGTMQDWYQRGSVQPLYTGPVDDGASFSQPDPVDTGMSGGVFGDDIGKHSDFKRGSTGNIRHEPAPGLQERYDFTEPHNTEAEDKLMVNYDLHGAPNGDIDPMHGQSNEHALGQNHKMDLGLNEKQIELAEKRMKHRCQQMLDRLNSSKPY